MEDEPVPDRSLTRRVVALVERARRRVDGWGQRVPLVGLTLDVLERYLRVNCVVITGYLAFRLFLVTLPMTLLIVVVAAMVTGGKVSDTAAKNAGLSGELRQQVQEALQTTHRNGWLLFAVALIGTLYAGQSLARGLVRVHAIVWELNREAAKVRVGHYLVFYVWLFASVASGAVAARAAHLGPTGLVAGFGTYALIWFLLWWWVSIKLPNGASRVVELVPGALLVALALTAMHVASSIYLPAKFKHASQLYGALGVASTILVWLWVIGNVVVIGALVNAALTSRRNASDLLMEAGVAPVR